MLRSPKFIWAICLAALSLTLLLVNYTQQVHLQLKLQISPKPPQQQHTDQEKYVTFLPHSGLHNQRLALINGLILAKALNRTLLLPQINIGRAIKWRPTPISERRLAECYNIKQKSNPMCKDFGKYVPSSVESVFDLAAAHALGIRTLQRTDMSLSYFEKELGLSDDAILRMDDNTRFSYRAYDSRGNNDDMGQFTARVEMDDLRNAEQNVIIFGSLHYTKRVALQDPMLIWLGAHLREETSIAHPIVMRQALNVLPMMGGPDNFVGVHLRQGDGYFKAVMDESLADLKMTLEQSDLATAKFEREKNITLITDSRIPTTEADEEKLRHLATYKQDPMELLTQCLLLNDRSNHPRLRLIYMATDTPQPRVTLQSLYNDFPCIFTLSDFPDIIESTLSMNPMVTGNDALDEEMRNLGTKVNSLFIPMIDAEITSHGYIFIGTRRSTFSQYINHRYLRYQKTYHPSA
jgi:hypothetical protein